MKVSRTVPIKIMQTKLKQQNERKKGEKLINVLNILNLLWNLKWPHQHLPKQQQLGKSIWK